MSSDSFYGDIHIDDAEWGAEYRQVLSASNFRELKLCCIKVSDVSKIASMLTDSVQNTSWMMELDVGTRRSYNQTVQDTVSELVAIFLRAETEDSISGDFGELMVSMGAARALELIFEHDLIPISEIWKSKIKNNDGFDFHTVDASEIVNFGEAKFNSNQSSFSDALRQANDFIGQDKHVRDRPHIINFFSDSAISNLDNDCFGIVAAFSIHSMDPLVALKNAVSRLKEEELCETAGVVYLVGVCH